MIFTSERLLKLVGPVHVVGGLLLFTAGFSPTVLDVLESLLVGNDNYAWSAFFSSVLGPTIASWGILFAALVHQFYITPTLTLWRSLVISVVIWAPFDTALCMHYGIYIGAIINSVVLLLILTPLLNAKRLIR